MSLAYKIEMRKKHIAKKKAICKDVYGFEWYKEDGCYNKGKIHCSCPICSEKTNDKKLIKSNGPVSKRESKLSTTHKRYGRKNWTISDKRKLNSIDNQLDEEV